MNCCGGRSGPEGGAVGTEIVGGGIEGGGGTTKGSIGGSAIIGGGGWGACATGVGVLISVAFALRLDLFCLAGALSAGAGGSASIMAAGGSVMLPSSSARTKDKLPPGASG